MRFIPSAWEASEASNKILEMYRGKKMVWEAVKQSGLDYTAIRVGVSMNYLASGSAHRRVLEEYFDGLPSHPFIVDVGKGTARMPGIGKELVAFTTT